MTKEFSKNIDWLIPKADGRSLFQYLLVNNNNNKSGLETAIVAIMSSPELLEKEMEFIVKEVPELLGYKEVAQLVDISTKIDNINILTYLTNTNKEHYVRILTYPEKSAPFFAKGASPDVKRRKETKRDLTNISIIEKIRRIL